MTDGDRLEKNIERVDSLKGASRVHDFELASVKIPQHGKTWEVQQYRFKNTLSYELPLFVMNDNYLRCMKFQIKEKNKGLNSPNIVKKIWLDFHISDQNLEVTHV